MINASRKSGEVGDLGAIALETHNSSTAKMAPHLGQADPI